MKRDSPSEVQRTLPRNTMSYHASSGRGSNVVVSRSTVRRKPPGRAVTCDRLAEMRSGAMDRYMIPTTPMSNRQRLALIAALEMSAESIDSDDNTINSNTSSGSIALKNPGESRDREREDFSSRRRRSSSSSVSAARALSRRNGKGGSSHDNSNVQGEERRGDKDRSSRSERGAERSTSGGSSSPASGGSNRNRSSSRRPSDRGRRSSSLNEKRNSRAHKLSTSKSGDVDMFQKSPSSPQRPSVTEEEIMELLSLDHLVPRAAFDGQRGTNTRKEASKRSEKESTRSSKRPGTTSSYSFNSRDRRRDKSPGSPHSRERSSSGDRRRERSSSRDRRRERSSSIDRRRVPESPRKREKKAPRELDLSSSTRSIDRLEREQSHLRRSEPESPRKRDKKIQRELDMSNSSLDRKATSSYVGGRNGRRSVPRKAKSEQKDLDSFLKHGISVSRRVKAGSGSRSVVSMPVKPKARHRRGSVGGLSDRTDTTEDTTKPSSSSYVMSGLNDDGLVERLGRSATIHHNEVSDEEDDSASIDLDLATARNNFQHQNLSQKLQMQLSKTDELLYSVFPRHVADALRTGQKVEPENHDLVTIFFSDIVGFTDISSKLDPMKISEMLDRLYNSFDALSEYHDVFKVETIGDAYMAVTNLAQKQPDHCKRISEFAIDAIRVANQTLIDVDNPSMGFVKIRVGFHSGPVVSNVVGTRNPRYCLFGDSVNTASRMESNSEENRIHCSEISAKLLREQCPKIPIFPRGSINVKGKGEMKTFWVHREGSIAGPEKTPKGTIRKVLNSLRGDRGPRNPKIVA